MQTQSSESGTKSGRASRAAGKKMEIRGVSVRLYLSGKGWWLMDFGRGAHRVHNKSTFEKDLANAKRVAEKAVEDWKDVRMGLKSAVVVKPGRMATVGDVCACMTSGEDVWHIETMRRHRSSLLRVARAVNALDPWAVPMDEVVSDANLRRFLAIGQGLPAVNWLKVLKVNGGLNSTLVHLRALFGVKKLAGKFAKLKMPDMTPLRSMLLLKEMGSKFIPWPAAAYAAMEEASQELRTTDPEMWLVNAMLRRLGLRDKELLEARRDWIEVGSDGRAELVIETRLDDEDATGDDEGVAAFEVLKHGAARRLPLDAELQAVLLPRTGYLIAGGLLPTTRYNLIYRTHSQWVRQFIPNREKSNHELRMHAGSVIYTRHGLLAASNFLGHQSLRTTEQYYTAFLSNLPMLDGAAVAGARVEESAGAGVKPEAKRMAMRPRWMGASALCRAAEANRGAVGG